MAGSWSEINLAKWGDLAPLSNLEVHEIVICETRFVFVFLEAAWHRYGNQRRLDEVLANSYGLVIDALGIEVVGLLNLAIYWVTSNVVHALVDHGERSSELTHFIIL